MRRLRHWLYAAVPLTAALLSACVLAHAAWIPVKAELAQWLIERSWQRALLGAAEARPWPWADTRAAGELSVPGLGVRLVVLEGASGRNLAFGPVFADGTASGRDVVISGHRDTHFRFLRHLQRGERIHLQRKDRSEWFEVRDIEIVDSRRRDLVLDPAFSRLTLVTCYPFDRLLAGGPLRYVATAYPTAP